jgi:hypothetical protein
VSGRNKTFRISSLLLLAFVTVSVRAEIPTLDYLFPAGGQQGATIGVTNGGKFEPWPPKVWIDCAGVEFNAETNKGLFRVKIAKDAPVGPHLIRTYNAEGVSSPKWFVIGENQELMEKEPNDSFSRAQVIEGLPRTINGRLEKGGDVDCFSVKLEAGKWLIAGIDAYAIGSPIDADLQLLNEHGIRVAFNSDRAQSLDPFLVCKVEKSGTYILQVTAFAHPPGSDIRFAGSPASVYRLSVTQGPVARWVFPAGARIGCKTTLNIGGWNFASSNGEREWEVDPSASADRDRMDFLPVPESENRLRVATGGLPEAFEKEPNNTSKQAQEIKWPVTINGRIDPRGDQDWFSFNAKKGERLEFRVWSSSLGFPLDPAIRIEDANGKQAIRDGDERSGSFVAWSAPSNATYRVVVSDLFHQGGPEFVYRLDVAPPTADFKVIADSLAYRLEPGKTNEVKLTITRTGGHTNKLFVTATNLPEGVIAKPVEIGGKAKEVKLILTASGDIKPFNGPFQIEAADSMKQELRHRLFFDLGPKESRAGEMLINQTDQFWLTVTTNSLVEKPSSK